MLLALPFEALYLQYRLNKAGYEAYLVGGAVRDLVMNSLGTITHRPKTVVTDYDCTTNATPEQIQEVFPNNFYENEYGTVSVVHQELIRLLELENKQIPPTSLITHQGNETHSEPRVIDLAKAKKLHDSLQGAVHQSTAQNQEIHPFEITTYRSDGDYHNHRQPTSVLWGTSITDDLSRRDFTINAIALHVQPEFLQEIFSQNELLPAEVILQPDQYSIIDPFNGIQDIEKQLIRTVGDPVVRFTEDALRMLRAVRLSVQLGCVIEPHTYLEIANQSHLLTHISGERIRDEFLKMLSSNKPAQAIRLLDESNLLSCILPELHACKNVRQGGHHTTDVWTHSLDALDACPSSDPLVRLATLIHDIGKPPTFRVIDGNITFYNHEIVGARMVRPIADRLKLSKQQAIKLYTLVRHHMFHYQPHNTDAAIRRFMRKVGLDYIDDILDLREGDRLGSGARKTSWRLEEMKQRMIEQLNQPMDVRDLAINGSDLMQAFQLKPGPIIGSVLHNLFERVLDNPDLNNRETLLVISAELINQEN